MPLTTTSRCITPRANIGMSTSKSFKEGRDGRNGQFVSVEKARNGDPDRYSVEHVPKKGHGSA